MYQQVHEQHFEPPADSDRTHQPGSWRTETSWSPLGSSHQTYYLAAGGALEADAGPDPADQLRYDSNVGATADLWSVGMGFGLAGDQRLEEVLSRTYISPVLSEGVYMLGRATVHLRAITTATVLGFTASLCDVAPDGSSHLVSKGILNATRRHSMTDPTPLIPGEEFELVIEIDATSWHFQRGHRLRLSIADADWPNMWPTPEPASSILHIGGVNPSRLTLPTVPSIPSAPAPAFEPAPMVPSRHAEDTAPLTWRVERDGLSRQAWVKFHIDHAARVSATTTIERSYDFSTHVDPQVPAQASTRGIHTSRIMRPSETVEAKSSIAIRGAQGHFHVTISVEVKVGGCTWFRRHWAESIPRVLC